jgi:hypothetical protein
MNDYYMTMLDIESEIKEHEDDIFDSWLYYPTGDIEPTPEEDAIWEEVEEVAKEYALFLANDQTPIELEEYDEF